MLIITNLNDNTSVTLNHSDGLEETHEVELATLPVLYSEQPIVKYQSSKSSYSLSNVTISQWSSARVSADYEWLVGLTKPKDGGLTKVKLQWGDVTKQRCIITSVKATRKEHLNGALSLVTLDLQFAESPLEVAPRKVPVKSKATDSTVKLSKAEQEKYVKLVQDKLNKDKPLAAKLGVKTGSKVTVGDTGDVLVDGKKVTTLSEQGLVQAAHKTTDTSVKANIPIVKGVSAGAMKK